MSSRYIFIALAIAVVLAGFVAGALLTTKKFSKIDDRTNLPAMTEPAQNHMQLTSSAFPNDGLIPSKYTCDGEDINPPLHISDAPAGTKSFVLIVDDPDAPAGDWVHWTVWNIAPETLDIGEDSIPVGATLGMTDFASTGWGGPCPPSGTHRYQFKLYALNTTLEIGVESNKSDIEKAMQDHILDKTLLVGRYQRP